MDTSFATMPHSMIRALTTIPTAAPVHIARCSHMTMCWRECTGDCSDSALHACVYTALYPHERTLPCPSALQGSERMQCEFPSPLSGPEFNRVFSQHCPPTGPPSHPFTPTVKRSMTHGSEGIGMAQPTSHQHYTNRHNKLQLTNMVYFMSHPSTLLFSSSFACVPCLSFSSFSCPCASWPLSWSWLHCLISVQVRPHTSDCMWHQRYTRRAS
jgi:hypothetical protein